MSDVTTLAVWLAVSLTAFVPHMTSQGTPADGRVTSRGGITDERAAQVWLDETNVRFMVVNYDTVMASWTYSTNMTDYNQATQLRVQEAEAMFAREVYQNASRFSWRDFPGPLRRQFEKVVNIGTAVLAQDRLNVMNHLAANLSRMYSTAEVCDKPNDGSGVCYPLDPDLSEILAKSRDWDELLWAWDGWRRASSPQMVPLYTRFVDLQNEAARLNGDTDMGASWRARYETPDFEAQLASLWRQVRPLYEQLHAYVSRRLRAHYVSRDFPESGHIPAHLLGNMWAQQWNNIQDIVVPFPNKTSIDVTPEMLMQGYNATRLFIVSEEFFTSLGLLPMPKSFWKKSMIRKPDDGRAVVCHASAWDFYNQKDFRIKQCTEVSQEWLFTTHHEMGHIQYFMQYKELPTWYRGGANSGFHEAIGDVMELSVNTPIHLHKIGLLPVLENDDEVDINYLMSMALKKISFLPFGYLIDQWRWKVFSGETKPADYNKEWWKLRCRYQGISPASGRPDDAFDAGSKFHVPNNTPYIRYFVSYIVQFQFHKALCDASGYKGPLHKCDIYQSKVAGKLIGDMMKMGSSMPWPDAMMRIAGSRAMDAQPLLEFFKPVMSWLEKENVGHKIGWTDECPDVPSASEQEAADWLCQYNVRLQASRYTAASAAWLYATNLTLHNQNISLQADAVGYAEDKQLALEATAKFVWRNFTSRLLRREFSKLTQLGAGVLSVPSLKKLNKLKANMGRVYSTGKVCNKPGDATPRCYPLDPDLTNILATSRDADELLWAWQGWRNVTGPKMADEYEEFVELQNEAARKNGYADHGGALKAEYEDDGRLSWPGYDFEADIERLWREVRPLYEQLHAYTRRRLMAAYPTQAFPQTGHIPAHLLGNMWAQSWTGLESLLRPFANKTGVDVTQEMRRQNYDAKKIFKMSEEFFTSLGLIKMPASFWNKSMITKPTDRDVICHASAWDFYNQKDFRIKQCTDITMVWLVTTHHEMGHIQYYLQYKDQPVNFRRGGNPGFHEAIGDVMALSVATPEHLQKVGLLPNYTPDPDVDLNFLMSQSLKKVAFLPFGYLIDQWRWDVFAGRAKRENYNKKWWDVRCRFQGISPPVARRPSRDFDPGAKFHIPANTPYIRYFISHIVQFQFHKALCDAAGHQGPLYKCDIYQSKRAGKLIGDMMKMGSSAPWPDAMQAITGSRVMSAQPLMDYFQPLKTWLERENAGHPIGWNEYCSSRWDAPDDPDDPGSRPRTR